ncbi:MAG: MMPL family transporter, partial [Acidobacteriota bacterium]
TALANMTAAFTTNNEKFKAVETEVLELLKQFAALQQRFVELMAEFTGHQPLLAVIETMGLENGRQSGLLPAAADALAEALSSESAVASVLHRIDPSWLLEHGVHLAPPALLEQTAAQLEGFLDSGESELKISGWSALNELLARSITERLNDPAAMSAASGEGRRGLGLLAAFLAAEEQFLADPQQSRAEWSRDELIAQAVARAPGLAPGGYLGSEDGSLLVLVVQPSDADDSLPALRRLVDAVRSRAAEIERAHPGVRVALTGNPALVVDEMAAVRNDTLKTSGLAASGVAILALLAFRWRSHAILALLALGVGVGWAWGAVRLEVGYLNMITSSFLSTLIGVGIAYAIHPISEYELEGAHTRDARNAVRGAFHCTGAAVIVSAVTTAGAFLAILLMDFRGFAEMGLVAGIGVLLCLVATLTVLPALLTIVGRYRQGHISNRARQARLAAVDRLWVDTLARLVCRDPLLVFALSVLATAASVWAAWGLRFDLDILELLPAGTESRVYLEQVIERAELTPHYNMVVADDLSTLRDMRERASAQPEIARFESILGLLPQDPERTRRALEKLRPTVVRLRFESRVGERGEGFERALGSSLQALEAALSDAGEAAFIAGLGELAAPLEQLRARAERLGSAVAGADAGRVMQWHTAERELVELMRADIDRLLAAIEAPPPTIDELPRELRRRFVTARGRYVAMLHPRDDIFSRLPLRHFNEACRLVAADPIGFPWMFEIMATRITGGFYRAFGVGGLIVLLTLLADFRALRPALLAMIPLAVGVIWLLGLMRLVGLNFNLANLVALPLVLGVGIDNGVHVIHRLRLEGEAGITTVLRHTGRAILIASLTTMIGFGSLAFASHRGIASLGMVLLLGVGTSLIAATVLLPNLLL